MANFNFSRLIKKYSTQFTAVIPSKGGYDTSGEFVNETQQEVQLTGAIISHRESKVYRAEGTITQQDKALYMLEQLPEALHGAKVIHEGKEYRIEEMLENSDYTGVWSYNLKYVSAFKKGGDDSV